jgi:hypothetical protein
MRRKLLEPNKHNRFIIDAYNTGKTMSVVADEFGLSPQRVQQILSRWNIERHPLRGPRLPLTDEQKLDKSIRRFWGYVVKGSDNECWEWIGYKRGNGYGGVSLLGKKEYAHRVSWELAHGPIQHGLFVLHKCDNPTCVNPAHLYLGTQADNIHDREERFNHSDWRKRDKTITPRRKPIQ